MKLASILILYTLFRKYCLSLNCYVTDENFGNLDTRPVLENCVDFLNSRMNITSVKDEELRCFTVRSISKYLTFYMQGCTFINGCKELEFDLELADYRNYIECIECQEDLCNSRVAHSIVVKRPTINQNEIILICFVISFLVILYIATVQSRKKY